MKIFGKIKNMSTDLKEKQPNESVNINNKATLEYQGQKLELPVVTGTENEQAIDISKLRAETGLITLDNGYVNTGSCQSAITFIDGEKGILRYRGIDIEELAERSNFVEVAYLLIYGKLPSKEELEQFSTGLTNHSLLHEDMIHFFAGYPSTAHPMAILSSMTGSLAAYYNDNPQEQTEESLNLDLIRLLSKLRTIACFSYKKSIGQPLIYPNNKLSYCSNIMSMMFAVPTEEYYIDDEIVKVMNQLLILHADHEQNCSTSTVRMVQSSGASIYACMSAGISALWGPLHGGANQAVLEMLKQIHDSGMNYKDFLKEVKDKKSKIRLLGFGHRVYKNFDP